MRPASVDPVAHKVIDRARAAGRSPTPIASTPRLRDGWRASSAGTPAWRRIARRAAGQQRHRAHGRGRGVESTIGDLVADAMRGPVGRRHRVPEQRRACAPTWPRARSRAASIYEIMPFDNTIVTTASSPAPRCVRVLEDGLRTGRVDPGERPALRASTPAAGRQPDHRGARLRRLGVRHHAACGRLACQQLHGRRRRRDVDAGRAGRTSTTPASWCGDAMEQFVKERCAGGNVARLQARRPHHRAPAAARERRLGYCAGYCESLPAVSPDAVPLEVAPHPGGELGRHLAAGTPCS